MKKLFICLLICGFSSGLLAQSDYKYSLDLTQVDNDQLTVELLPPLISEESITFFLPKLIPGTYKVSDYGKFVSDLKALDKKGRELPVEKKSENSWEIRNSRKLAKLTYKVADIMDAADDNGIYMMAASNIEANKNFVIHTPAFFGYFDNMKKLPIELSIIKPAGFFGSTGLTPTSITNSTEIFKIKDYDHLADSPLMYNLPDTTSVRVGNADVLISVYAPGNQVTSSFLAARFDEMLQAQKSYLGGKLPVDKYAFILYFADPTTARPSQGALEHSNSSFYYLSEMPQEVLAPHLVDIAAHEFFHIVTPLTMHSEEIANFNFNQPKLSKHLWLYEGVTEYASDHIQVRSGLNSPVEFLDKLAVKINTSGSNYDDNLAFTELSEGAAGKYASQYPNVYEKGALIAAMLDLRLIELSDGKMDLQDLILKMSREFGKDSPFKDDQLFSHIARLSYPEIGEFLNTYVGGNKPLPYEEYFKKAGILYDKAPDIKLATLGKVGISFNQEKQMLEINNVAQMNEFGKQMGYQKGDLLVSLQGHAVNPQNFSKQMELYNTKTKDKEQVEVKVLRKVDEDYKEVVLLAPAMLVTVPGQVSLKMDPNANPQQLKYRAVWINENGFLIAAREVESIDAIMTSFYEVISGKAGERNWNKFHALFKPGAVMAAMIPTASGELAYKTFTPKEYQAANSPYFLQNDFFEKEIGREEKQFGEIANVWSIYAYSSSPEAESQERGVNSFQLAYEQDRWWIVNILWNAESEKNKLAEHLPAQKNESK